MPNAAAAIIPIATTARRTLAPNNLRSARTSDRIIPPPLSLILSTARDPAATD
jgi:hypothetical protein